VIAIVMTVWGMTGGLIAGVIAALSTYAVQVRPLEMSACRQNFPWVLNCFLFIFRYCSVHQLSKPNEANHDGFYPPK
jgi:hypothetical protein